MSAQLVIAPAPQRIVTPEEPKPDLSVRYPIERIAIFKEKEKPDPVVAIQINGHWFSLFRWE